MPKSVSAVMILFVAVVVFYFFFGFFVVQPAGTATPGATIIYFRAGLSLPFIASADGLLDESHQPVSMFSRAAVLVQVKTALENRMLLSLPYSEKLYYYSTDGKQFAE